MNRTYLAAGAVLFVGFSASAEVRDLDARCVMRSAGDLAPSCDDRSAPHGRTVFAASVASANSVSISNGVLCFVDAEEAAERPDRRYPPLFFVWD